MEKNQKPLKIIILVQGTMHPEFLLLDNTSRATWQQYQDPDINIIPYYGCKDLNNNYLSTFNKVPKDKEFLYDKKFNMLIYGGRDYIKNFLDSGYAIQQFYPDIDPRPERWINTLGYILNNYNFDFIYRTCCSYYLDVYKLKNFIIKNLSNKKRVYTGSIFWEDKNPSIYYKPFVAGSNILMSRDTVEIAVKNKQEYLKISETEPEDTALGKLLIEYNNFININEQTAIPHCSFQENLPLEEMYIDKRLEGVLYKINHKQNYHDIKRFIKMHNLITQKYLK